MLSQRETRFHKQKIIGGSLLKNVYDKLKNIVNTGSKILNRVPTRAIIKLIPTQVKTDMKKLAAPTVLNDRSRAILSNLIAGSGFKNYMS